MTGSYFGFPAETIRKLYGGQDAYLAKVRREARRLVSSRYLLERDVEGIVKASAKEWDFAMGR